MKTYKFLRGLFFIFFVFSLSFLAKCSKNNEYVFYPNLNEAVIKGTISRTLYSPNDKFTIVVSGEKVIIDWGDENKEYIGDAAKKIISHEYKDNTKNKFSIIVYGEGINYFLVDPYEDNNLYVNALNTNNAFELEYLSVNNQQLKSLGLINNNQLKEFYCSNNQLKSLDLTGLALLEKVNCSNNLLATLLIDKSLTLKEFDISENKLTSLDLSKSPNIETLNCINNQIDSLYLNNNKKISKLYCSLNKLTSLDLTLNTQLKEVEAVSNQLKSLNLSNSGIYETILLGSNNIEDIDLVFNHLNDRTGKSPGIIDITGNAGALYCDGSIALNKNWSVIGEGGLGF